MNGDQKNINRRLVLRIGGFVLILTSAMSFLQILYTDIYASSQQNELRRELISVADASTAVISREDTTHARIKSATSSNAKKNTTASPFPTRIKVAYGKPFARIVIPRIKLNTVVVESVSNAALKLGPGHLEETAHPGEIGNMAISGHRVTYGRPFYYLDKLQKGDPIHIYVGSKKYTYYVVGQKIVNPRNVSVLRPTKDQTLTLITCHPRFSAKTRLVVVAKMRQASQPKASGKRKFSQK